MFTFRSMAAAALLCAAGSAMAADGTITFTGKIIDQTCNITTPGGADFTVTLPTVAAATLASAGDVAGRTPFSINLSDCAEGDVATYFEPGPSVDFETGRLVNQAAGNTVATNVQIQLLGENNQFVPILAAGGDGAQQNSQWVTVPAGGGGADLHYYAEYYATGQSGAGDVSSNVQYTIIYK
ncbi:fimbrial protein [Alloalcanivorax gelatiniphagus]|uniref:Type 1 fimbrial protein n=1 Tax=Alloalcanivorax gelatiniphagus TaxID=1194167 RepID=A0ABY2XKB2_9GAMM|nr:fimbrial protein [Alloalcanivorax gelatiniphagus]TMW12497.1 type 1 fimbrial protein [Alloalcanivorax gelatiniphagus]